MHTRASVVYVEHCNVRISGCADRLSAHGYGVFVFIHQVSVVYGGLSVVLTQIDDNEEDNEKDNENDNEKHKHRFLFIINICNWFLESIGFVFFCFMFCVLLLSISVVNT